MIGALLSSAVPALSYAAALEEVVVTATRRGAADIMTTPVSVTAITTQDVERYAPVTLNDIASLVPNLSAGVVPAFKSASFAMRGVAEQTIIVYKEAPVGVTIDDFVVPHVQTQNLEMFDIEQIEVLRGPQGTLFGKNTTAGVINVKTKRPDVDEGSVDVRGHFGDFGTRKYQVAVNVPLIEDKLAFRFAGMDQESDGYYRQKTQYGPLTVAPSTGVNGIAAQGNGSRLGGDNVFSGRAKLLWKPTDGFNALFQYEYINDDGDTVPVVNDAPEGYLFNTWGYSVTPGDRLDDAGVTGIDDRLINMSKGHRVDIDGYYLNMDWDLGGYSLHSVTGYREQSSRLPSSYGGEIGPVPLFDATRDDDRETFQQELRVVTNFDGPLNFTAGGFYQTNDVKFCVAQLVGFVDLLTGQDVQTGASANPLILCNAQDATAYAAFIDGTYQVTDRMRLSAGLRYTIEEKEWIGRPRIPVQMLGGSFDPEFTWEDLGEPLAAADFSRFPSGVASDEERWEEPTYRVTLDYDLTDEVFLYANYSHGFKSGGYSDQIGTQLNPLTEKAIQPTDLEIADSFELGIKADLFDRRANIAATAFHVTYTDAQRTLNASFDTGQETLFFNAAELVVEGVELEGSLLIGESLMIRANGSWQDAEFNEFSADTNFDGVDDVDLSGKPPTRAPELMGTIAATYTHSLFGGDLAWDGRVSYEDESVITYSDVAPEFDVNADERTLVDASVTWQNADRSLLFRVLGKNLTDERYRTGGLSVGNIWIFSSYGLPRYYAFEAEMRFDF